MIENTQNELKRLALICSFFFFPVGICLYIRWANDNDPEKRRLGKQCLIASIIPTLLAVISSFIF